MSITRYTLRTRRDTDGIHADAIEAPSGKYVTHEDHIASLLRVKNEWGTDQAFRMAEANAKDAEIARLNAENKLIRGAMASDDRRLLEAGQRVGIINGCDTPDTMADEIESLRKQAQRRDAEIAALRDQRDAAQIAVAMKQGEIVDLSDRVAALRERCGRLVNLYKARDKYEDAMNNHAPLSGRITPGERIERHLAFITAKAACEGHNDLAPPKGDNDG